MYGKEKRHGLIIIRLSSPVSSIGSWHAGFRFRLSTSVSKCCPFAYFVVASPTRRCIIVQYIEPNGFLFIPSTLISPIKKVLVRSTLDVTNGLRVDQG